MFRPELHAFNEGKFEDEEFAEALQEVLQENSSNNHVLIKHTFLRSETEIESNLDRRALTTSEEILLIGDKKPSIAVCTW